MDKTPKRVEIDYNYIKELFRLAGVKHSVPPTNQELEQMILSVQSKLVYCKTIDDSEAEYIKNLLYIEPVSESDQNAQKPVSILVVDDLVMVTYQLSILLSKIGYNVTLARSAPEALSIFKSRSFEYVLMDLYVPDKEDGLYLLHSLQKKVEMEEMQTKIIVMSGMADASSVEHCLMHGASAFIEKNEDWKKDIINCLHKL